MSTRRIFLMNSLVGLATAVSARSESAGAKPEGTEDLTASDTISTTAAPEFARVNLEDKHAPGTEPSNLKIGAPLLRDPIWYYSNWSAYDELADNVELTEELAMRQLDEIARLRTLGVKLDYYLMDAFWYAPDGAYRTWRKPHWPNGPDRWIAGCQKLGVKPGLWFSSNSFSKALKIDVAPQWKDSLVETITEYGGVQLLSFSQGGYLNDFMSALQFWYDRGIRMFKLDFADFWAAAAKPAEDPLRVEAFEKNKSALRKALKTFRKKNSEAVFTAYNVFIDFPHELTEQDVYETAFQESTIDLRWLEVFDSLYSGDARPSDIPQLSFWRSMDLYSDQQVRFYEKKFVPLDRIDSAGFMSGDTNTSFHRKMHAWKSMLLLNAARGGWVNTIYGCLQYLDDDKARWFAKVQQIYLPLQAAGRTKTFGRDPGEVHPYGFASLDTSGSVYTVVNPTQEIISVGLPYLSNVQPTLKGGRVIFRDAGFVPELGEDTILLGPGQVTSIGFGRYSASEYDLGIQEDVSIPTDIRPITAQFAPRPRNVIEATILVPTEGDIRIVFQIKDKAGNPQRAWGDEKTRPDFGKLLKIWAEQGGKEVPVEIDYDRYVWSGLSWASGEIRGANVDRGQPITIHCSTTFEEKGISLIGQLYAVKYERESHNA